MSTHLLFSIFVGISLWILSRRKGGLEYHFRVPDDPGPVCSPEFVSVALFVSNV
jgi:hypothetical protein